MGPNNGMGVPGMQGQPVPPSAPNPVEQALHEAPVNPTPMNAPMGPTKKSNSMLIGMILLAVLAAGGIGFGVWAMMDGNSKVTKFEEQIKDLKKQNAELLEKLANEENVEEEEEPEIEDKVDAKNYIVVEEWGIKIKKPDNATDIMYEFNEETKQSSASLFISKQEAGTGITVGKVINCDVERPSDQKCFAVDGMYFLVGSPNADDIITEEFISHFNNSENYSKI